MGRNNYSYNGMLSVITRKPIFRYKSRQKTSQEVVDELRGKPDNRKVDSITNIISRLFTIPEVYLERNRAGPKIDLNGNSNVSVDQDSTYTDLGATSSEAVGSITVDETNVDLTTPGTYYVTYTAIDSLGFSNTVRRYVVVEEVDGETGTPSDPIVLTVAATSPYLDTTTLYRGKTYKFSYGDQSGWTSAGFKFTTQTASPASTAVKWEIGVEYGPQFSYYTTWTVPETCPDTMHFFCPENGKELLSGTLTIAYPTDRALPTRYKIRWLDPDQIFPAKIDRDNIDNAFARVENLFTGRRPAAEAAELHFDTTVTMANNAAISSAANGGPTASDYSIVNGQPEYNGWTESAQITWKTAGRVTVAGNDSIYDKAGVAKNYAEMTVVHEGLHGIGVGSTTSLIGRNFNGNTGLTIRHPTDPGSEGSENYLWTGSNALAWYKTHFGSAISSDIEGVPFKAGDLTHWDDYSTGGGRALERTINGKTYLGIWDEMVTTTGGDYITGLTAGLLKDIGLPINMSNVETSTPPTVAKTWAFDVGTGLTLTANTDVYTNTYTNSSLSGTNPEIKMEPDDVIVLNILAGGATVNVYSNTSTGNMEWNPLTTGVSSGTITVAPTTSNVEHWLYNSVFYTDGTNHGKITVNSIVYREGRDHDLDGVYNNRDPQSLSFTPEYTIFTGSKADAAMKWQGSSTGYYSANTSTVTNFPLYKASTNTTIPTSGYTVSDGEPWALSTAVICGRRQAGWDQDSGIVLLSAQGGADGNITLSTHENKDTGDFYAKFRYGTSVEITTGNITFNHYYTGFYVDYDGAQGFRMFTYDYKTETLTQVPSGNVVVTGTVGPMRAANFEVAKTPNADRYWNGRISHVTTTTLRTGVALPTNAEVLNMIKNPDTWLTTYKVGNPLRLPGTATDDSTAVAPTSLSLDVFSGYFRLDGSLISTQGTLSSPNYSLKDSLVRGATYSIDLTDSDLNGKQMRLSTSSVYHISLAAAQANIYSSNVTYTSDSITISAGDDTPNYLFLFDNSAVNAFYIGNIARKNIYLTQGVTYTFFNNDYASHPLRFSSGSDGTGTVYSTGLSGLGSSPIIWDTSSYSPGTSYYFCGNHSGMGGEVYIQSPTWTVTIVTYQGTNKYAVNNTQQLSLNLTRGATYTFNISDGTTHPFNISTEPDPPPDAPAGTVYGASEGVSGLGTNTITWTVASDAPSTLYYYCDQHSGMGGTINLQNSAFSVTVDTTGPRDGPIEFTGSGYPVSSSTTTFTKRSIGDSDSTAIQRSAQATKVYYFTGILAGGPTVPSPEERFRNDVSYDATEHFLVSN